MKKSIINTFLTLMITVCSLTVLCNTYAFAETDSKEHGYLHISESDEVLPVYTIQKSSNDNENFNILFFGDGYTADEQEKMLDDIHIRADRLLKTEPFRSHSSKINIYAVPTVSEEKGVSDYYGESRNTYFGLKVMGIKTSLSNAGDEKARKIKAAMEENYMDNGATIGTIHILSNSTSHFGSSTSTLYSFASLNDLYAGGEASLHEIAHSIGKLKDEYGVAREGVNASTSNDPEVVQWSKFLGFRGIGIINNENSEIYFIPSRSCMMASLEYENFCEVCKFELMTRMNLTLYTQSPKEYHAAVPDITIEHSSTGAIGDAYKKYRINDSNITNANGHNLEFRTIVQNFSKTDKQFKLTLEITDANGERKFYNEKIETIAALTNEYATDDARKSISVTIDNVDGLTDGDKVSGQLIDVEQNKVIATDKSETTPIKTVSIHHKLKTANGVISDMPNTKTTTIYIPQGTTYTPATLHQLNGYSYIGNSLNDAQTEITDDNLDIDFYYENDDEPSDLTKGTSTSLSDDGKTFTITPFGLVENNIIFLALYDENHSLIEVCVSRYSGNNVTHTTTVDYSFAEVMVFKDLTNIQPICNIETVKADSQE